MTRASDRLWLGVPCVALLVACSSSAQPSAPPPPTIAAADAATDAPAAPTLKAPPIEPPPAEPPAPAPRRLRLDSPRTDAELPTTSCDIYLRNAQSNLEARQKALQQQPDNPFHHLNYGSSLFTVGQLYGNLDMVAQAEEVATRGLAKDPRNVSLLELRSEARGARHRFEDALADLELARTLAPPQRHADLDFAIANVHYQLGRYDDAVPLLLRRVVDRPSFSSQNRAAIVYLQTGNVEQARRHFAMAESMYKDTSPIPLSWLNVQRGLLEMHAGNYELAHTFFEEAWRRCPTYPMAKEHLAEIEGRLGHLDRSIALYGEVVSQTSNPEYIAALGEAWEKKGEPAKAAEMFRFAKNKNEQLLARHPDAMYWHAAAFYLGPGKDPAKALTLLTKNAKLRPTGNAWAALADAHLALGKPKEASVSIDKALASPLDLPELHWTAARVYKALGDQKISDEHKALALAANPKIADLEGDLDPPEDAPAANATP